ncbi:MAG: hypothetical protein LBJ84_03560 [Oscillospiraceae bacterium]|jgi:hypothetical protein|nr:hypothetical protein [Oscillospiraceae bacterium]
MKRKNMLIALLLVAVAIVGSVTGITVAGARTEFRYPVNANGMTYGSGSIAYRPRNSGMPDLIAAVGVDGVTKGYIKNSDLLPMPKNPEEALEQNALMKEGFMIPLYDVDGETVIGEFFEGGGSTSEDIPVEDCAK